MELDFGAERIRTDWQRRWKEINVQMDFVEGKREKKTFEIKKGNR